MLISLNDILLISVIIIPITKLATYLMSPDHSCEGGHVKISLLKDFGLRWQSTTCKLAKQFIKHSFMHIRSHHESQQCGS